MPIYEYCCPNGHGKFELLRPISRAEEGADCPTCHSKSKRALSKFVAKSATDFSTLNHMAAASSGGGSSCSGCSSSSCSSCGK